MSSLAVVLISFSIALGYGIVLGAAWRLAGSFPWLKTTKGFLVQAVVFVGVSFALSRLLALLIELVTGCTCLTRPMQVGFVFGFGTGFIAEEVTVALAKRGILRVSKEMPF